MNDLMKASPPNVPPVWCTCGKRLYWCGVRELWVDGAHRASHDVPTGDPATGRTVRQPHNTQGVSTLDALKGATA